MSAATPPPAAARRSVRGRDGSTYEVDSGAAFTPLDVRVNLLAEDLALLRAEWGEDATGVVEIAVREAAAALQRRRELFETGTASVVAGGSSALKVKTASGARAAANGAASDAD